MPRQFGIHDVKNRAAALKKARARISRLNKTSKGYRDDPVKLTSLVKDGKSYLVTIVSRRRSK